MGQLDGKVAIVTGSGRGIGREIALRLARDGAAVVVNDLDEAPGLETVEAVKAVSELFMPVSGEVLEVNARLDGEPALINNDPYGDGWMIKVRMAPGGDADLMTADAYKAQLGE